MIVYFIISLVVFVILLKVSHLNRRWLSERVNYDYLFDGGIDGPSRAIIYRYPEPGWGNKYVESVWRAYPRAIWFEYYGGVIVFLVGMNFFFALLGLAMYATCGN